MKKALIVAGLLSVSSSAFASSDLSKFYILGGVSDIEESDSDESRTGFNIILGGEMTDNVALETAFYRADFDETVYGTKVDASVSALTIAPVIYFDLNENFTLLGKAGVAYGFSEAKGCSMGYCASGSDNETAFTYGAGLQVNYEKFALRFSYDKYSGDNYDFNVMSASVGARF